MTASKGFYCSITICQDSPTDAVRVLVDANPPMETYFDKDDEEYPTPHYLIRVAYSHLRQYIDALEEAGQVQTSEIQQAPGSNKIN